MPATDLFGTNQARGVARIRL